MYILSAIQETMLLCLGTEFYAFSFGFNVLILYHKIVVVFTLNMGIKAAPVWCLYSQAEVDRKIDVNF